MYMFKNKLSRVRSASALILAFTLGVGLGVSNLVSALSLPPAPINGGAVRDYTSGITDAANINVGQNTPSNPPNGASKPVPSFSALDVPVITSSTGPVEVVDDLVSLGILEARQGITSTGNTLNVYGKLRTMTTANNGEGNLIIDGKIQGSNGLLNIDDALRGTTGTLNVDGNLQIPSGDLQVVLGATTLNSLAVQNGANISNGLTADNIQVGDYMYVGDPNNKTLFLGYDNNYKDMEISTRWGTGHSIAIRTQNFSGDAGLDYLYTIKLDAVGGIEAWGPLSTMAGAPLSVDGNLKVKGDSELQKVTTQDLHVNGTGMTVSGNILQEQLIVNGVEMSPTTQLTNLTVKGQNTATFWSPASFVGSVDIGIGNPGQQFNVGNLPSTFGGDVSLTNAAKTLDVKGTVKGATILAQPNGKIGSYYRIGKDNQSVASNNGANTNITIACGTGDIMVSCTGHAGTSTNAAMQYVGSYFNNNTGNSCYASYLNKTGGNVATYTEGICFNPDGNVPSGQTGQVTQY